MQTTATGAVVVTKQKKARKATSCKIDMDLKNNKGILRDKKSIDWDRPHGTSVEFVLDGRIQLKGEAGLLTYLRGTVLLNPHLTLHYKIGDEKKVSIERVTDEMPTIPDATDPHPHTMKLGEFISHARLFGRTSASVWLKKGFSRISDRVLADMKKEQKIPPKLLSSSVEKLTESDLKVLFSAVQKTKLMAPATNTVLSVGEDGLALSINRIGDVDFFAVLTRKPVICDFKPVQVEVAIARLRERPGETTENPVQVLRFANRVPLQFDKSACAIVKAINTVPWRNYGLRQPKNNLPLGPYIIAVSVVSPFIKFKNASKETIDASDELVEELRRSLMQAGQRLSRYLKREHRATDLETKSQHIEQFGPILVETLGRILDAPKARKERATAGLAQILERDTKGMKKELKEADARLSDYLTKKKQRLSGFFDQIEQEREVAKAEAREKAAAARGEALEDEEGESSEVAEGKSKEKKKAASAKGTQKVAKKAAKKATGKKATKTAKKVVKKSKPAKKATTKKKAKKKKR
jgi:DNA topoisomerase-6 subunit B